MKAVTFIGPRQVGVETVEDPRIETPTDCIVRMTSAAIGGSDLHMYEGRTAAEPGLVFGHEPMRVGEDVGIAVYEGRSAAEHVEQVAWTACGFRGAGVSNTLTQPQVHQTSS